MIVLIIIGLQGSSRAEEWESLLDPETDDFGPLRYESSPGQGVQEITTQLNCDC